jgi:hypothetical protein
VPSSPLLEQLSERLLQMLVQAKSQQSFGEIHVSGTVQEGNLTRIEVGFVESLVFRPKSGNNSAA